MSAITFNDVEYFRDGGSLFPDPARAYNRTQHDEYN